jgi:type III pantothenate kinase
MVPLLRAANVKIFRIDIAPFRPLIHWCTTFGGKVHLAIDIGNSRIKWARFENKDVIESGMLPETDFDTLSELMHLHTKDAITVSSVVTLDNETQSLLKKHRARLIDSETPIPVKNGYGTPATLGIDRLCAAIGAKGLFPDAPVLVIDIGTCIKFEFVNREGVYEGGNISPGLQMRYASLNNYTSKLPHLKPAPVTGPIGSTTEEALRLGVQQGMLFEIQTMINTMETLHPGIKTVGTGGDLPFFVNDLKTHIFADLLLVLRGINEIHLYNN